MITDLPLETVLEPLQGFNLPFLIAHDWYAKHTDLSFRDDLCHYHLYGYVGCTPAFFLMGKLIRMDGDPAFFVRFACGRISEGVNWISHLPGGIEWIAFYRNNQGKIRKYRIDRTQTLGRIDSLTSPLFSMEPKLQNNGQRPVEE